MDGNATAGTYDGTNGWPIHEPWPYCQDPQPGESAVGTTQVTTNITGSAADDTVTWDVTDIVNDWLLNGKPNSGFYVSSDQGTSSNHGDGCSVTFNASEYGATDSAAAPTLNMTIIPEPSSFVLLVLGGLLLMKRRRVQL